MDFTRRKFLSHSVAGTVAMVHIPAILSASITPAATGKSKKYALFQKGDTVLFQGDSITDAGRDKKQELPNNPRSFGSGYAFLVASALMNELADPELTLYYQLAERWQKDCLDLKPDVLSILIGVNDYWHKRNGEYNGTVEVYENDYRALLQRTREHAPHIRLIICEPFYVLNTSAVDENIRLQRKESQRSSVPSGFPFKKFSTKP